MHAPGAPPSFRVSSTSVYHHISSVNHHTSSVYDQYIIDYRHSRDTSATYHQCIIPYLARNQAETPLFLYLASTSAPVRIATSRPTTRQGAATPQLPHVRSTSSPIRMATSRPTTRRVLCRTDRTASHTVSRIHMLRICVHHHTCPRYWAPHSCEASQPVRAASATRSHIVQRRVPYVQRL